MKKNRHAKKRTRCDVSYICNHDNNSVNKNAVVLHMNNITTDITRQNFFFRKTTWHKQRGLSLVYNAI